MRLPSLHLLLERTIGVLRRFPWTIAVGVIAAAAASVHTELAASSYAGRGTDDGRLVRLAFVAALGLPTTIALTLLAEARRWSVAGRMAAMVLALAALAGFFVVWPGMEERHHVLHYLQLSAVLHLSVAFLPLVGTRESAAFWQYNRRLLEAVLRATLFAAVLFVGLAVALGALDELFGVDVVSETYLRIWFIMALVVHPWIFLAAAPDDLRALEHDTDYPRPLKVFAQYILTPLVFIYLLMLLAYLVKIVVGGEWPSGWIGWLVASVSVMGLLGLLLVHPLRFDPEEGWIRIYARWLFLGLIPAALMLLAAFWKRILPYGFTEPRLLGVMLGLWLLGIALLFTFRPTASIRTIPVTLAVLLLLTLYGPLGFTSASIDSQGRRFAALLPQANDGNEAAAEASAALRFLIGHRAIDEIAARIGQALPPIAWDSLSQYGYQDSLGKQIMALAGATYVPQYSWSRRPGHEQWFNLRGLSRAVPVADYDWMIPLHAGDTTTWAIGRDSVRLLRTPANRPVRLQVGGDTLRFDLVALAAQYADSVSFHDAVSTDRLMAEAQEHGRRAILMLEEIGGAWIGDSLSVRHWRGWLLLAARDAPAVGW